MTDLNRTQHLLNTAADAPLPTELQAELTALRDRDPASQRFADAFQQLDRQLHNAPMLAPSPDFAARVMTRVATAPGPVSRWWERLIALVVLGLLAVVALSTYFLPLVAAFAGLARLGLQPDTLPALVQSLLLLLNTAQLLASGVYATLSALARTALASPVLPLTLGLGFGLSLMAAQLHYQLQQIRSHAK